MSYSSVLKIKIRTYLSSRCRKSDLAIAFFTAFSVGSVSEPGLSGFGMRLSPISEPSISGILSTDRTGVDVEQNSDFGRTLAGDDFSVASELSISKLFVREIEFLRDSEIESRI